MRWFAEHAERLHDTGWPAPIPLRPRSKAPLIAGWPAYNVVPVGADTLAAWVRRHPCAGIGHPAGHGIAFVDMDEDDPARAARLQGLTREVLGATPLRRVGRPPREVAVYGRAAGSGMLSVLAAVPSLSLYLDSGQVALLATHPGTGRPYVWPIEDPTTVAPGDLPAVSDAQLAELLDAAAALQGGSRPRKPAPPSVGEGLATPVLAAMHGTGARTLEVARRHVIAAEPGHRHYHLAGAIAALVRTGFSDEQIHAAVIAPFIALFDPVEARRRRPGAEALALLAWARQQIGGPAPDVALPRPRWARA